MTATDLGGYVDEHGTPSIPQDELFPPAADSLFPYLEPVALRGVKAGEKLSAGRRLTLRQRADVERGRHPLTRSRIDPDPEHTCGTCAFRVIEGHKSRSYPKCHWRSGDTGPFERSTSGPATDVRKWWPGCTDWRAKP